MVIAVAAATILVVIFYAVYFKIHYDRRKRIDK